MLIMAKRSVPRKMPVLVSISTKLDAPEYAQVPIKEDKLVVGRSLSCCFAIPDVSISRRHCVISRVGEDWTVTDEGTTGVFVNDQRVEKGVPTVLKDGDEIKFGSNLKWHYIFSLSEDFDDQSLEVPNFKRIKTFSAGTVQGQVTVDDNDVEKAASEIDEAVASGLALEDGEVKSLTQEDKEDKPNELDEYQQEGESGNKDPKDLNEKLRQVQKISESFKSERKMVISALKERDQQLQNLMKNTHMEKTALRKKLKELQVLLAEKEKKEEEDKRRLEEETRRVQMLEEENKKQEESNKKLIKRLMEDIEKREQAAKLRFQEALDDLHKDKIAIETEIKEKSEAKEDVEKLLGELETVKQNLLIVEQKRKMLEKELTEAKEEVSVCTFQAREEIIQNLGVLMESELQCSICNELFCMATTLTCDHTFCKYCITEWKKKKKECPICRRAFTTEYRSLPLDNFINKLIENLSDEIKTKRKQLLAEREAIEKNNPKVKKERKKRTRYLSFASNQRNLWQFGAVAAPGTMLSELVAQNRTSAGFASMPTAAIGTRSTTSNSLNAVVATSTSTAGASTASTSAAGTSTASTSAAGASTTSTSAAGASAASTSRAGSSAASTTRANSRPSRTAVSRTTVGAAAISSSDAQPAPQSPTRSVSPPLADYVIVDLSNSSYSEGESPGSSDYSSDSSYAEGLPGSYYGGYGNCYNCGRSGHWANGCPEGD